MRSSLVKVRSYVTDPIIDRDGTELPVSRLVIVLGAVFAVALMVIVAQWFEPNPQRLSTRSIIGSDRNWRSDRGEGTTAGNRSRDGDPIPTTMVRGAGGPGRKPAGSRDSVRSG